MTITSNILDTTNTSTAALNYTNSSDVSELANLGITLSTNYDGTVAFDPTVLTSALNSDFSGVLGFFQNVDSWGQTLSATSYQRRHQFVVGRFDAGLEFQQQFGIHAECQRLQGRES